MNPLPHEQPPLLEQLQEWMQAGALRALDLALTHFIAQQVSQPSDGLLLATALVSERNSHGHVCLDLQAALREPHKLLTAANRTSEADQVQQALTARLQSLDLPTWVAQLQASEAVNREGSPLVLAGSDQQPLLYLRRYWQYEQQIQTGIQQRLAQVKTLPLQAQPLIKELFQPSPGQAAPSPDWQKIASVLAARRGFAIITGGPGTGKTTTVVRLLALLQGMHLNQNLPLLQIRLAAPTGKAAARLNESLGNNIQQLSLPGNQSQIWRDSLPREVTTLHRLLGSQPGTRHFRHHSANPLPADLVVVDEASMVDVEMMAKLLEALRPDARLILLGDKDQLASVEAGSILGDLCRDAELGNYHPATHQIIKELTGEEARDPKSGRLLVDEQGSELSQATAMLRHSFRFHRYPGIGQLAETVNQGQASLKELEKVFNEDKQRDNASLTHLKITSQEDSAFIHLVTQGYLPYLQLIEKLRPEATASQSELNAWAEAVFAQHRRFQLLTALRQGDWGIEGLNQRIFQALKATSAGRQLLPSGEHLWYSGRPVLMTRNDYSLQLMNGDIGICLQLPRKKADDPALLRVAFPDAQKGIRWVLPSRLQEVETVFAMTVHKSQGSEFQHTALVLPPHFSPVLTKELLYTGITRSSQTFTLVSSSDRVLEQLLLQQVDRASGLKVAVN
ncbi:exodeoxyribonuclease V subunit alpha [Marinospirillum sp.]|uniref:exodeoxyribonuclease V subunit alpha n=1 Tax=Marinospirillum sp. TaxID=2183934 RepID=UPI00384B8364